MWLPDMRGRAVSWQKQQMFLVSVHVDVQLSLLHGEGLDEVHRVMKRRTGAVRRLTNFVELELRCIHPSIAMAILAADGLFREGPVAASSGTFRKQSCLTNAN
jgi:hypothetical protein